MVSYDDSAKRAVEGPCTQLSLQASANFNSWFPDAPERPHPDLLAENIRLSEELARMERSKRRCLLQAEQRKAELEQEVSSMRNLIMQMLGREPSLGPLAAAAGFPMESCNSMDVLPTDLEELMSQNAQLFDENRRLTAELADRACLDADSARLEYETQRQNLERAQRVRATGDEWLAEVPRTLSGWLAQDDASSVNQQLLSENRQLQEEKVQLAAELSRAERERRRLVLLEAQSRAELEQCQKTSSPTSSEPLQIQPCQPQVGMSEQAEDVLHGGLVTDPCFTPPAVDQCAVAVQTEHEDGAQSAVADPEEMTHALQHVSVCHEPESFDSETAEKLQLLLHRVSERSDRMDASNEQGACSVLDLIHELEAQWEAAESRWRSVPATEACIVAETIMPATEACMAAEVGTQTWELDSQVDDDCQLPLPDTRPSSPVLAIVPTPVLAIEPAEISASRDVQADADAIGWECTKAQADADAIVKVEEKEFTLEEVKSREAPQVEQSSEVVGDAADVEEIPEDLPLDVSDIQGIGDVSAALEAMGAAVQLLYISNDSSGVPVHPMTPSAVGECDEPGSCPEADQEDSSVALSESDSAFAAREPEDVQNAVCFAGCEGTPINANSELDATNNANSELDAAALHAVLQQLGEHQEHLRGEVLEAREEYARSMEEHRLHLRDEMTAMQEECSKMTSKHHQLPAECGLEEMDRSVQLVSAPEATRDRSVQLASAPESTRDCRSSAPEQRLQLRQSSYMASEAYADLAADCERHMNSEIMAAEKACAQVAEQHQQNLQEQFAQARGEVADACLERPAPFHKGQESQPHVQVGLFDRHAIREVQQPVHDMTVDASIQLTAALLNQQQQLVEQRAAAALAHARAEAMRAELCRRGQRRRPVPSHEPTAVDVRRAERTDVRRAARTSREPAAATSDLSAGEPQRAPRLEMRLQPRSHDGSVTSDGCCSAALPQMHSLEPKRTQRLHHSERHKMETSRVNEAKQVQDPIVFSPIRDSEAKQVATHITEQDSEMALTVVSLPIPSTEGFDSQGADTEEPEAKAGDRPLAVQGFDSQEAGTEQPEAKTGISSCTALWRAATPKVHASPPRPTLARLAKQDVDTTLGTVSEPVSNEGSCPEMPKSSGKLCEQQTQTPMLGEEGAARSSAGDIIVEGCEADDAALAEEVKQLWEEERRLTASVVAVRFVSDTVQAFYERQAVAAARESSEQLQEAALWHAAKTRAESRRAELSQEEEVLGAEGENHGIYSEALNSSCDSPFPCKSGSRRLSLELRRRGAHADAHASSGSGSLGASSSSEDESSPSSEFAFQLGPRSSLHKRSCKRRGDTSVWSQITQYHLAGESDNDFPANSAGSRASGSGVGSARHSPLSPRRAQQAWPRGAGFKRSKTLPPMDLADIAVTDVSPRNARRRGRMMRAGSFSHMPRDGASSTSPRRTSFRSLQSLASRDNSDDSKEGAMGGRRIAGHRRVNSGPTFRNYSHSPVKLKHKRQASGSGSLLQVLGTLTPHRRSSPTGNLVEEPMSPGPKPQQASTRALIEGFFHIVSGQSGAAEAQLSWPSSVRKSRLEQAVVGDGFCPSPEVFSSPDPAGFSSEPFVFSLLETTLDPSGDPSGVLYGCVCSETGGLVDPCTARSDAAGDQSRNLASPRRSRDLPLPGVLCIVSKLPLFALLFEILGLLRSNLGEAEPLLHRICASGFGKSFATEGVDVADFHCGVNRLRLRLPRPLQCDWQSIAQLQDLTPLGGVSQTFAQWQAAWGLSALIARWDNLVGDTLAKLLACVLLEQKVMLLGDVPRISMMALVLRGLIWPFRWLHPYLSAPPPPDLLRMPLPEAPYPLIVSLTELPKEWGYRTHYELPPEMVTGVLKHDYIYVSPELETTGGLKGTSIKLPAGRHTAFRQQVTQAKKKLRTGELSFEKAVASVQEAAETEIQRLVDLIRRYVTAQVDDVKKVAMANSHTVPAPPAASLERIRESCSQQASDVETFTSWFKANNLEASSNSETVSFYRTFFQTQLCLDFMNEEINAQTT